MTDWLYADLVRQQKTLAKEKDRLCQDFAYAHVHKRPEANELKVLWLACYIELDALDLLLASYDPQQALFLDLKPSCQI